MPGLKRSSSGGRFTPSGPSSGSGSAASGSSGTSGFMSAAAFLKAPREPAPADERGNENLEPMQRSTATESSAQCGAEQAGTEFTFSLTAVGLKHHDIAAALVLATGARVRLVREPTNPIDRRAIRVMAVAATDATNEAEGEGEPPSGGGEVGACVGHLDWRLAHDLAPLLDSGDASILSASVTGRRGEYELFLSAHVAARGSDASAALSASDALNGRKVISVGPVSLCIGARDAEDATAAARREQWPPPHAQPWQPEPKWADAQARAVTRAQAAVASSSATAPASSSIQQAPSPSPLLSSLPPTPTPTPPTATVAVAADAYPVGFTLGWPPHTPAAVRPLTPTEVAAAQAAGWPPPNGALLSLGLGPASDTAWWAARGLLPPAEWRMAGALDMLPACKQSISANLKRAAEALDGGAHGCSESGWQRHRTRMHAPLPPPPSTLEP